MDANIRGYHGTQFNEGGVSGVNDTLADQNYVGISGAQPNLSHDRFAAPLESESHADFDFNAIALKYINDMLMEEDAELTTCMFQESVALQAAERSFYEILREKYPPPSDRPVVPDMEQNVENPDDGGGIVDAVIGEYLFQNWDFEHESAGYVSGGVVSQSTSEASHGSSSSGGTASDVTVNSPASTLRIPEIFSDSQFVMRFRQGVDEANKFLPHGNELLANTRQDGLREKVKECGYDHHPDKSKGKKNRHHEDVNLQEGRRNKQPAIYSEPAKVNLEMFDMVLLSNGESEYALREELQKRFSRNTPHDDSSKRSSGGKSRGKKQRGKRNVVDLRALLIQCAEAIAVGDPRTPKEFLKQIREHSSKTGDGMQRLAHYFADGLEARIAGSGTQIYKALISLPPSGAGALKAYHLYLATIPVIKINTFVANKTILNVSEKATRLHIVDFGILWGFRWPWLIQQLSSRPGGPPKLRITGIDFPRPGFKPLARVEETGQRLAYYADSFKVPFEFNPISQKWDTIKMEDLKIEEDEMIVVHSFFWLRLLPDETLVEPSPRDVVLNLMRRIKPDVFLHGIRNGAYNSPFFISRFKEALLNFSFVFDMLEANIPREIHERMLIEREIFGRQVINVVACEGAERVERPETYKQWQVRNIKAGFKQLPFDPEIVKMAKNRVKSFYHKDLFIDEDSQWLLQGWKGRTLFAISAWKPAD